MFLFVLTWRLPHFQDKGWKGWGEVSYGGYQCVKRAKAADFLVTSLYFSFRDSYYGFP